MNDEDLERQVVQALHDLYPEPVGSTLTIPRTPPRRPARVAAIVAAVVAVAAVGVTVGLLQAGSPTGSGPNPGESAANSASYIGYKWRLTSITTHGKTTAISGDYTATIAFSPDGMLVIEDTNTLSGRYEITQSGFVPHDLATTLLPTSDAGPVQALIDTAFFIGTWEGAEVRATTQADNTLILSVGTHTMSFERVGTAENIAPTPTSPTHS